MKATLFSIQGQLRGAVGVLIDLLIPHFSQFYHRASPKEGAQRKVGENSAETNVHQDGGFPFINRFSGASYHRSGTV